MELIRRRRYGEIVLKITFLVVVIVTMGWLGAIVAVNKIEPEKVVSFCESFDECTEETMPAEEVVVKKSEVPIIGTVYLTFDDGPGEYTGWLLDILKQYGVKATFFVTGRGDDDLIRRAYDEGHAIGLHTMSHNYAYIYDNADNFFADLYAVQERVRRITGQNSYLMRFPGGSSNTVSRRYDHGTRIMSYLTEAVEGAGFRYYDWNVTSGDAGGTTETEMVAENVILRLEEPGDYIVLQHDIKDFSVAAVPEIIEYGLGHGYEFKKLEAGAIEAHHGVNN
ncbi:polysaccharide deacetylase [Candidatus Saccharibacteria bacterium]|nr:polysaccharide deacetylase [Candidatus Saccharibacteria bacterium]